MKYSYNWLKELVRTEKSPEELANLVMLKGFELEEIVYLGKAFEKFVVGKIVELGNHPNADKLQVVKVDVGKETLEVVCGAWNINVGDLVPVALVGAIVPQNKIKVAAREVRGVKSQGMLCAEDELGLGKEHGGIMLLDEDAEVGKPLAVVLGLEDVVVDFSILPNRAHDCLSHIGMAREIAAMEGKKIKNQSRFVGTKIKIPKQKSKLLSVKIEDRKLCPRYIGAVLSNIKIGPSPQWMQSRLVASGMEPINNVVDITNYVMLEVGNPLHAFDAEKLKATTQGEKINIVVRKAKPQEQLALLDGKMLDLDENDLLITNGEIPLALAGIKGGNHSGISNGTGTIVLESANFNAYNIRKTRQRHALTTESQLRFEKSISPVLAENAVMRAIELLEQHAGAKLEEVVDANYSEAKEQVVELDLAYISHLLGHKVKSEQIVEILTNLGFMLKEKTAASLSVLVPYWRLDIEGPEDLIEELGRITGYENIEETPIVKEVTLPDRNRQREFEWAVKDLLTGIGFDEVINYSFYGIKDAEMFGGVSNYLEIDNALTVEQSLMRKTLLAGIFQNVSLNEKYYNRFNIFELGRVYFWEDGASREELKISGAGYNDQLKAEDVFYELKGKLQAFLEKIVTDKEISFRAVLNSNYRAFNLPRTALVFIGSQPVGIIGEVSAIALKQYGIKRKFCAFELDFTQIFQAETKGRVYRPLRKFPDVKRDISMFLPISTEAASVMQMIKNSVGKNLLEAELFDVYLDKEQEKKSLAFHLVFGAADRTLESGEVDKTVEKVIKILEEKLKAEVRKQ